MKSTATAKRHVQLKTDRPAIVHKTVKPTSRPSRNNLLSSPGFVNLFSAQPSERIELIRHGVPASFVITLSKSMGVTKESLFTTLRLPRATIDRKVSNNQTLPPEQGERVLGMAKLVGQVQVMVEQSGDPAGFDAARWVARWMDEPSPALGGKKPAAYMDTVEGQELVSNLVAKMQSGAYA